MTRIDIINGLIAKHGYTKYLEIGVQNGISFAGVKCAYKIGVDPDLKSKATFFMTSDQFFAKNKEQFDIVFIDGLHLAEQAYKDAENAMKILSDNGTIVWHDCLPPNEQAQGRQICGGAWTGDVWKGWVKMKTKLALNSGDRWSTQVVDTDFGVGIMRKDPRALGAGVYIDVPEPEYKDFVANRDTMMSVITPEGFTKLYLE